MHGPVRGYRLQLFLFCFVMAPIFRIACFRVEVLCPARLENALAPEIIRGGIVGVARGQKKAGDTVRPGAFDKFRHTILWQALPLILPPLTGLLVSLAGHSAIVSVITVAKPATMGMNPIADTFMAFGVWLPVVRTHLVVTTSLSVGGSVFGLRLNRDGE